jgi:hypothetical protein
MSWACRRLIPAHLSFLAANQGKLLSQLAKEFGAPVEEAGE